MLPGIGKIVVKNNFRGRMNYKIIFFKLEKLANFIGAVILKIVSGLFLLIFILFLLYSVKSVIGINLFENLSLEDFLDIVLTILNIN